MIHGNVNCPISLILCGRDVLQEIIEVDIEMKNGVTLYLSTSKETCMKLTIGRRGRVIDVRIINSKDQPC